jgi:hypothetical protein
MWLFLIISAGMSVMALGFRRPEARSFPLIVGIVTSVIIVAYMVIMRVPALKARFAPYIMDDLFMRIAADEEDEAIAEEIEEEIEEEIDLDYSDEDTRHRRELALFGFLVGFGVLGWLVGITFAVPLFMLVVMRGYSGESWRLTIAVTVAVSAFLYAVFVVILRVPLHLGLLGGLFE